MNHYLRTVLLLALLLPQLAFAQLGGLLQRAKEEGRKAAQSTLEEKAKEEREKTEQAERQSLLYALTLADDAGSFETREKNNKLASTFYSVLGAGIGSGFNARQMGENAGVSAIGAAAEPDSAQGKRFNSTGEWLYRTGRYKMARSSFQTAIGYLRKDSVAMASYLSRAVGNLGLANQALGRYPEADSCLKLALTLREKTEGTTSPGYFAALNNYGVLNQRMGRYAEAEQMLAGAAKGLSQTERKEPHAIALNNEAMLLSALGRYDEAEGLLRRALQVAEELDAKGVLPVQILGNLALTYQGSGQLARADSVFKAAISRQEKRLGGRSHPDIARLLNGQAALYMQMGQLDKVEALLTQSLGIYRRKFGEQHPTVATTLHNLGTYYRMAGKLPEAQSNLEKALAIRESQLGQNHPDWLETREALALTAWQASNWGSATEGLRLVKAASLDAVRRFFPAMSETEKSRYWARIRPRLERFGNYAIAAAAQDSSLLDEFYDLQLATKAILLNSASQMRERILGGKDEKLKQLYRRYQQATEQLALVYSQTKEDLQAAAVNVDSLEKAQNELEKQLSLASAEFGAALGDQSPKWQTIQKALPADGAAVEMVRLRTWNKQFGTDVTYAALVLVPGVQHPMLAYSGRGAEMEGKALTRYRRNIRSKTDDNDSYGAYWEWVQPALKGRKNLYVSLDGVYNQLNLQSLRMSDGKYLLEQQTQHLLVSTRELPALMAAKPAASKTAILLGNPAYGAAPAGGQASIAPLPGTATEVSKIKALLIAKGWAPSTLLVGEANEAKLKAVNSPRILHIATHGYFLPDVSDSDGTLVFGVQPEKAAENPLLRSGLLLAGAESTVQNLHSQGSRTTENGILTAYEALNLKLRGTELVVLSACETGLGDVQAGEGVFGLQRAFQLAGARALILSLWRVDDAASQELMSKFYTYWLAGKSLKAAFQQAQLDLKAKYPQPYYWSAFVLIGA